MSNKNYRRSELLGYLVHRTSRLIRKYFNKELMRKGYRLTEEQYDVLVHLWFNNDQHQQDIAIALCKDKTTITRLIKDIETLKFVKRTSNKKDKRQKLVCLTASGKVIIKELMSLAQELLSKAQKGIDLSDIAVCNEVLIQINETISRELTKAEKV